MFMGVQEFLNKGFIYVKWLFFLVFLLFILPGSVYGVESNEKVNGRVHERNLVNIYFIHSNDCSHCKQEGLFLNSLEERYSNVAIYRYEIHDEGTSELLEEIGRLYKVKAEAVPITIIAGSIYMGYNEEKSPLKFIKTIEYYSRYGYQDKAGEYLQIENLPFYKIEKETMSLEDFMNSYGNYKLFSSVYTDDLDLSFNAYVLGIKSECTVISVFCLVVVLMALMKYKINRHKIPLLVMYLGVSFLSFMAYVIQSKIFTLVIEVIIMMLLTINLLRYTKNRKRYYLLGNGLIVIAVISNYMENRLGNSGISVFKALIPLHNLTGLDKVLYYMDYLGIVLLLNILFILLFWGVMKRLRRIT